MALSSSKKMRLPPDVSPILHVRNLPFKVSEEDLFDLFGKYGGIRQIRVGAKKDTSGTAYIVYDDIFDANSACEHLQGYNVHGRYLITQFFQPNKTKKVTWEAREQGRAHS